MIILGLTAACLPALLYLWRVNRVTVPIAALSSGALAWFAIWIRGQHRCIEGDPPVTTVVFLALLVSAAHFTSFANKWLAVGLATLVAISSQAFVGHLARSYHSDTITGNPRMAQDTFWHTFFTGQHQRDPTKKHPYDLESDHADDRDHTTRPE